MVFYIKKYRIELNFKSIIQIYFRFLKNPIYVQPSHISTLGINYLFLLETDVHLHLECVKILSYNKNINQI